MDESGGGRHHRGRGPSYASGDRIMRLHPSRLTAFVLCLIMTGIGLAFIAQGPWAWWLAGVAGALSLLGLLDLAQTKHSIQRNYPVIGHIRWLAELVRPELRQYLFEADEDA